MTGERPSRRGRYGYRAQVTHPRCSYGQPTLGDKDKPGLGHGIRGLPSGTGYLVALGIFVASCVGCYCGRGKMAQLRSATGEAMVRLNAPDTVREGAGANAEW